MLCEFDYPIVDNVIFEVRWIVDGKEVKVENINTENLTTTRLVSRLKQMEEINDPKTFVAGARVSSCPL